MSLLSVTLLLSFIAVLLPAHPRAAQEGTLISFKIKDQFGRVYTDEDYRGRVVVVIAGGREGRKYSRLWTRAIKDSLEDESGFDDIRFLRLANMRGVPPFMREMVRGKLPKEKEKWVLLDWKGEFAEAYQFEKGVSNIFVFDRHGVLVHQTHGREPAPAELGPLLATLETLIRD